MNSALAYSLDCQNSYDVTFNIYPERYWKADKLLLLANWKYEIVGTDFAFFGYEMDTLKLNNLYYLTKQKVDNAAKKTNCTKKRKAEEEEVPKNEKKQAKEDEEDEVKIEDIPEEEIIAEMEAARIAQEAELMNLQLELDRQQHSLNDQASALAAQQQALDQRERTLSTLEQTNPLVAPPVITGFDDYEATCELPQKNQPIIPSHMEFFKRGVWVRNMYNIEAKLKNSITGETMTRNLISLRLILSIAQRNMEKPKTIVWSQFSTEVVDVVINDHNNNEGRLAANNFNDSVDVDATLSPDAVIIRKALRKQLYDDMLAEAQK